VLGFLAFTGVSTGTVNRAEAAGPPATISVGTQGIATCGTASPISITVRDANGAAVSDGTLVQVMTSGSVGGLTSSSLVTIGGTASTSFIPSLNINGNVVITATSGGAVGTGSLAVQCGGIYGGGGCGVYLNNCYNQCLNYVNGCYNQCGYINNACSVNCGYGYLGACNNPCGVYIGACVNNGCTYNSIYGCVNNCTGYTGYTLGYNGLGCNNYNNSAVIAAAVLASRPTVQYQVPTTSYSTPTYTPPAPQQTAQVQYQQPAPPAQQQYAPPVQYQQQGVIRAPNSGDGGLKAVHETSATSMVYFGLGMLVLSGFSLAWLRLGTQRR
jgi:hypothetical protein